MGGSEKKKQIPRGNDRKNSKGNDNGRSKGKYRGLSATSAKARTPVEMTTLVTPGVWLAPRSR